MPASVSRIAGRVKEINTLLDASPDFLVSKITVGHVYARLKNGHLDSLGGSPPGSGESGLVDLVYVGKPQIDISFARDGRKVRGVQYLPSSR